MLNVCYFILQADLKMKEGSFTNNEDSTFDMVASKVVSKIESDGNKVAPNAGNGLSLAQLRNQLEEKDKIILSLRQTIEVNKYHFQI